MFGSEPCVAAIQFAIERSTEDGLEFLRYWNEGDWDAIREEWPKCPQEAIIDYEDAQQQFRESDLIIAGLQSLHRERVASNGDKADISAVEALLEKMGATPTSTD